MSVEELNIELAEVGDGVGVPGDQLPRAKLYLRMTRRQTMGCPLPDYVNFAPGTCPEWKRQRRAINLWTHHTVDPMLRAQAGRLRSWLVARTAPIILGREQHPAARWFV